MRKICRVAVLICFILITHLFFIKYSSANSEILDISIKPDFSTDEIVTFNYTFVSDINQNVTYIVGILCPDAPISSIQQKSIVLNSNKIVTEFYSTGSTITEEMNRQICNAYIQILSPEKQTVSKNFTIQTRLGFSLEIKTCKDSACTEKLKVFAKGETIYLDYSSSVESPSITSILTYPNDTSKQISLPSSIKATQTGTYNLDVTASKSGYKTQSVKEQFGVIKGQADIASASACNSNGRCDAGESGQTCPQDCKRSLKPGGGGIPPYLLPFLVVFIAILIVIMIFLIKKKPKSN